MSRAKLISCVAISIVIPADASSRITASTSADELRVERARDLVQQHQLGPHRERADDRHALLLAAREPVGILVALVREPEALEQLERARLRLGRARASAPCAARA